MHSTKIHILLMFTNIIFGKKMIVSSYIFKIVQIEIIVTNFYGI